MRLGLTGGMGCGKSTAVKIFASRGYRPVDSDALIRERILTDPEVTGALRGRYGAAVFSGTDDIDRAALAARVFADDAERAWLEALTHPRLYAIWRELLGASPRATGWIFEVPLLFEQHLENWFDFTVTVACSRDQQLVRLERRGLPSVLAEQRISKQLPLARKIELADVVLWNDGSPAFLQTQIDSFVATLSSRT